MCYSAQTTYEECLILSQGCQSQPIPKNFTDKRYPPMQALPPSKGRILCTEDDSDTRELIVLVLDSQGFAVTCAESADQAIELARTRGFDLYLVDNRMPDLSGTELTEKLRDFD